MSISCTFPAIGQLVVADPPYLDLQLPPCDVGSAPEADGVTCALCPEHMVSPTGLACVCGELYFLNSGAGGGCERCMDGVNCTESGLTTANLPLLPGYWRTSNASVDIRRCATPEACDWHTLDAVVNVSVGAQTVEVVATEAVPCAENRYGALCEVRAALATKCTGTTRCVGSALAAC